MGDGVNLKIVDEKYIYFTSDINSLGELDSVNEEKVASFLKDIFVSLSEVYNIDLFGYYKVDIYVDGKIGAYVEILKIDDFVSYSKKIDTKVSLVVSSFYLKTSDLSKIFKYKPIYFSDDNYYVSTKDVDNLGELMDFCDIEYKNINLKENVL